MNIKLITTSIWYRKGLYLPMLTTVTITMALIGSVKIVENSFQNIIQQEMKKYGANVILKSPEKVSPEDSSVPVSLTRSRINRQDFTLARANIDELLNINPAWLVKGTSEILIGKNIATQLEIDQNEVVEIAGHSGNASILDSGTEFDSYILLNGKVENPSMIFIRTDQPEKYRNKNAVILEEMVHSKYIFLERIKLFMLYVALISAVAAIAAVVNLARLNAGTRRSEFSILKALGASQKVIRRLILGEFTALSVTSGLLGVFVALVISGAILYFSTNSFPKFTLAMVFYVFITTFIAFFIAGSIYLLESKKDNLIAEIRGE